MLREQVNIMLPNGVLVDELTQAKLGDSIDIP